MSKTLKVLELTPENFAGFGKIITVEGKIADGGDENFRWYDSINIFENINDISINLLECKHRVFKVDKLEYHNDTQEAVIPLGGKSLIIVAAPAGKFDENNVKAFYLRADVGVIFDKGIRHFIPYPIKENVNCVIVFKHSTGANDLFVDNLSEAYDLLY